MLVHTELYVANKIVAGSELLYSQPALLTPKLLFNRIADSHVSSKKLILNYKEAVIRAVARNFSNPENDNHTLLLKIWFSSSSYLM